MKPPKPHMITVALRMAGIAGQDKLNGIFEHLGGGRRWQLSIYRTVHEFTAETVRRELERGTEGFVVGIPGVDDALSVLASTDVPLVVMNVTGGGIERRRRNVAFVKSDSTAVGRAAASELMKQGVFKSFAYAGYRSDEPWSVERGKAFADAIAAAGFDGSMFDLAHYPGGVEDRETAVKWLRGLPKPCGVLAACDDRAFEILDACREAGIDVPREVAVLGVNNDPILCENAEPRLSSVQPDFLREGRLAAELLERMFAGLSVKSEPYLVGVRQIVHRDSTRPLSEAGLLVQKALAYIDKNALKGIGVQDVARHLKVSYSLLNLRFQTLQGRSLYSAILERRLDAAKRLLASGGDTVAAVAQKCGWSNPLSFKNLFRKRFAVSPAAWRASRHNG